ncbi:MAG: energy transducer TonB, partial [Flavobacteriales bacterium]|nr:energy transducer TonB [Flavobacteriales bacterium]
PPPPPPAPTTVLEIVEDDEDIEEVEIEDTEVEEDFEVEIIEEPEEEVVEEQIFTIVEEMPSFPGGEEELFKYLGKSIKYPQMAADAGISGVVYVTFVVDKDGKVKDAKVLRGIGGGCDEEAIRVVKAMPPWKPGKQRGKAVKVQYNLPIRFTLK